MSDFKAKMHQIRFPVGLRPRPHWGACIAPPDPLAVFKGPTSKAGRRKEGGEEKGKREWGGVGREGRGREGKGGEWEHASIGIFESRRLCKGDTKLCKSDKRVTRIHIQLFLRP